ncbi:MAG: hypothetical protein ABJF09_01465 [Qipengyuania citrea]|uniref:hypothetical protein n=1 Tax=Qipengyuania citrea TaxID=225971 RepID=UPI00326746E5
MSAPKNDNSNRNAAISIWTKTVQTQEHFNEIGMKVRTMYATVLAGIISLYGIFVENASDIRISKITIDAIVPICIAVIVASTLLYFVDRYWYHRLLMGAVKQGSFIEERWKDYLPEMGMGSQISSESPVDLSDKKFIKAVAKLVVKDKKFHETDKLHSDGKIEIFYKPIRLIAIVLLALSCVFGGLRYEQRSAASYVYEILPAPLQIFGPPAALPHSDANPPGPASPPAP